MRIRFVNPDATASMTARIATAARELAHRYGAMASRAFAEA